MDITLYVGETVVLLCDPRDTRDQGWILSDDVVDVIFTIRETEEGEAILQLHGEVEKVGASVDDPGTVAVVVHTVDTKALPTGEYYYDITLITKGHWFDIDEHEGLYAKVDYGKVKDANEWLEVGEGWVELTDDTTNFLQVTDSGDFEVTESDYETDSEGYANYNLYRIVTKDGEVIDTFPYSTWFAEGTHSGLDFYYEAGYVLNASNVLTAVNAGHITLKADITNYVEVSPAGVVSSNITKFTEGSYPLYTVVTETTSTGYDLTATAQSTNMITELDDRSIYVRGDMYTPSVKSKCTITWTPTEVEE